MDETNVEQLNQNLMEDQNTYEEEVYDQTSEPESKSGSNALGYLAAMAVGGLLVKGYEKLTDKFVGKDKKQAKKEAREVKKKENERTKLQKKIDKCTKKLDAIDAEFEEVEEPETNDKEAK